MTRLTATDIEAAQLPDWRLLSQALHARFRAGSFVAGLAFVTAVTQEAETMDHHPDVTLTYSWVDLSLVSHDVGHVSKRDIDLARRISAVAAAMGMVADPGSLAEVELALDTADLVAQGPFWAALLTGDATAVDGHDVVDPNARVPLLWFQPTEPHETPRQRFHLDLWVPADFAQQRIAVALNAGGTLVDDRDAPSVTILADPEGNRVCVCTSQGREWPTAQ